MQFFSVCRQLMSQSTDPTDAERNDFSEFGKVIYQISNSSEKLATGT